jgi:hypothetical protein
MPAPDPAEYRTPRAVVALLVFACASALVGAGVVGACLALGLAH